ncbi:hypothetical protein QQX98_012112 [Neonectria punicea]|uniref:HNH nuclease domain-containing protein n=1 Tax=Neonectria punicea TaxID=979145 RepID=A0ABR1GJS2_9HYPO
MTADEPSQGETRAERLHRLLDAFLSQPDQHEQNIEAAKNLLKMDLPFELPTILLPVDEAAIRRDYAVKIESTIRGMAPNTEDFRLNAVQLATILTVPLSTLKDNSGYLSYEFQRPGDLQKHLQGLPSLLKHFLQKNWTKDEHSRLSTKTGESQTSHTKKSKPSAAQRQEDADEDFLPSDKTRNATETKLCRHRDGHACVVMGTSQPEACHIVPFAWNSTQTGVKKTSLVLGYIAAFFDSASVVKYDRCLANANDPGSSDKAWNMLCLNRQLHWWWSKAQLGFKCLGIEDSSENQAMVTLQFNWMPRQNMKPTDKMTLTGERNDVDAMVGSAIAFLRDGSFPPPEAFGRLKALHSHANRPILSGHIVKVPLPKADATRFKAMIDFQWAIVCVAALSGAAGAPELLPDHEGWGDPDLRTALWVEAQAEMDVPPPELPATEQEEALTEPEEIPENRPLRSTTNSPVPRRAPGSQAPGTPPIKLVLGTESAQADTSPTKLSQRTEQAPAQGQASGQTRLTENMPPGLSRRG